MSLDPQTTEVAKESALAVLGINWKIFIAQLVNFLIIVLILWRWVWRPLVKIMEEREEKISKSLDQAKEIEERLKLAEREQASIIAHGREEAQALVNEAMKKADEKRDAVLMKTKEEVRKALQEAKQKIASEQEMAREALRQETVELVAALTEKMIGEKMDAKKDKEMVEAAMKSTNIQMSDTI